MIKKLVPSLSFPSQRTPAAGPFNRAALARSSYRTRSASLPTRLHPLAAHIEAALDAVILWMLSVPPSPASSASSPSSIAAAVAWLSHGLVHLYFLIDALSEVLHLPQAQDSLRRLLRADHRSASSSQSCNFADRILDDFLRLTDAYASFRSATLELRHNLSATHAALRCRNYSLRSLSSCVRSRRRTEREIARLAPVVREVGKRLPVLSAIEDGEEAEVAGVMREVLKAAADASVAMFSGVASISASATPAVRFAWVEAALRWRERARARLKKNKWLGAAAAEEEKGNSNKAEEREVEWRNAEMERLEALEEGVGTVESGGEKVFRALVNTRVCLLNIGTPDF